MTEFKCANRKQCVNKNFVCDGEGDCPDFSDEKNCGCLNNEFKCRGTKCISNDWLCDGINDCPDKSDEHDSRCLSRSCAGNAVKCINGKCIPKYFLCNGIDNCGDNSDELKCNSKKNDSFDLKSGCKFGSCSQMCLEKGTKGTFQCKCANGYHKLATVKNAPCRAMQGMHFIFTASESELKFIYGLNYGVPESSRKPASLQKASEKITVMPVHSFIKTNASKIISFDFYVSDEKDIVIFWLDSMPSNTIQKMKISTKTNFDQIKDFGYDERNTTVLTIDKMKDSVIKSLSVDWVTSKLYFIENDIIKAIDFEGKNKRSVIDAGANSWDLVLDPEGRKIYWSTMTRVIYVASMDGSQKKRLVTENIEFASGLTIDFPSRRLYWCDLRKSTIETTNMEGGDRQVVRTFEGFDPLHQLTVSPMKLDVFEDELYVVMDNKTLYKLNKFGWKKDYEELNKGPYKFKASQIKVVHGLRKNDKLQNPCKLYPCDESAVCYLSSTDVKGRSCNCPDNLYIQNDGTSVKCLHKSMIAALCYKNCVNGGKCVFDGDSMVCECSSTYDGEFCEHYICSEFCKNQGICVLPANAKMKTAEQVKAKRKCLCLDTQWKGARCEIPSSACEVIAKIFCLPIKI